MAIFSALRSLFSGRRIATPQDLQAFLESRSADFVQKSIAGYAEAQSNRSFAALLGESGFQHAFEASRWKAFPSALSAVAEVLTGALRERLALDAEFATEHVQAAASHIIATYPLSDFAKRHFWDEALQMLESELARATLAPPRRAETIAQACAENIFSVLPPHRAIKTHDFELFKNVITRQLATIAAELAATKIDPGATPQA